MACNGGIQGVEAWGLGVVDTSIYLALHDEGLFRSSEHGLNWERIDLSVPNPRVWSVKAFGSKLFVGSDASGVFSSEDGGESWHRDSLSYNWSYVMDFAAVGSTVYAGTAGGVLKRSPSDTAWQPVPTGIQYSVTCLYATDSTLIAGSAGYPFYVSTDGGANWGPPATALPGSGVTTVVADKGDLFVGHDLGLFRSTDSGSTWSRFGRALDSLRVCTIAIRDSVMLVGVRTEGVYRSMDRGSTWSNVSDSLPDKRILSLALNDSVVLVGTDGGIFRSADFGARWRKCAVDSSYGFAILSRGRAFIVATADGIFRSADDGQTWSTVIHPGFTLTLADGGPVIYAGATPLLRSTDDGVTWGNCDGLPVSAGFGLASTPSITFVGSGNQIYYSTDHGDSWTFASDGFRSFTTRSMAILGSYAFAVLDGDGIYRMSLEGITGVREEEGNVSPSRLALDQNYPNPFNPRTRIRYSLPRAAFVRLSVFDLLGREVALLVEGVEEAGEKVVTFNGVGFPSGVYFYRLDAGGHTSMKKMLLLK